MQLKNYLVINLILVGLITSVFVYSGLFTAEAAVYPVPSFYEKLTGETSPSSGMSRAFSELVRGRLASARAYNEDSPLIFAFFLIQLVQRIVITLMIFRTRISRTIILYTDILLSLGLLFYCFKGQINKMAGLLTHQGEIMAWNLLEFIFTWTK